MEETVQVFVLVVGFDHHGIPALPAEPVGGAKDIDETVAGEVFAVRPHPLHPLPTDQAGDARFNVVSPPPPQPCGDQCHPHGGGDQHDPGCSHQGRGRRQGEEQDGGRGSYSIKRRAPLPAVQAGPSCTYHRHYLTFQSCVPGGAFKGPTVIMRTAPQPERAADLGDLERTEQGRCRFHSKIGARSP